MGPWRFWWCPSTCGSAVAVVINDVEVRRLAKPANSRYVAPLRIGLRSMRRLACPERDFSGNLWRGMRPGAPLALERLPGMCTLQMLSREQHCKAGAAVRRERRCARNGKQSHTRGDHPSASDPSRSSSGTAPQDHTRWLPARTSPSAGPAAKATPPLTPPSRPPAPTVS